MGTAIFLALIHVGYHRHYAGLHVRSRDATSFKFSMGVPDAWPLDGEGLYVNKVYGLNEAMIELVS